MYRVKYLLSAALWMVTVAGAHCQLAVFQDDDAMITPCFRTDVIKAKRIYSITIHDLAKPDNMRINDDGIMQQYIFDTTGKLIESISTIKAGIDRWDTIKCRYCYDSAGNLAIKRIQMGDAYDSWYYRWNKDKTVRSEYHVHEAGAPNPDGSFNIASQRVVSQDSFAYIIYPKQIQQYSFNEDNKMFQKIITQYDDNKRFLGRSSHYAVSWLYTQVDVDYDSIGRIDNYVLTGNMNGEMDKKITIHYDSLGNIAAQGIWEDGKKTHHIEYMYDDNLGLISDKLDRDLDKATIYIYRYNYEVYPNNGYTEGTR